MDAGKLPWLALSFAWVVSGRLLWAIYYKGIDTARHETWFCQRTGNQGTCGKLILNSLTWAMNSQENVRVVLNQLFHLVSRQECSQHFRKACIKKKKKKTRANRVWKIPNIGKWCFSHLVNTYSMRALSAAVYLLEDFGNLVGFHYWLRVHCNVSSCSWL